MIIEKCMNILSPVKPGGLVRAWRGTEAPKLPRLTNKPVGMQAARYIAEQQPGGAIIHWHGKGDDRVATVYSRYPR